MVLLTLDFITQVLNDDRPAEVLLCLWFVPQMKKHMQDLNNKISRQGLDHNEL